MFRTSRDKPRDDAIECFGAGCAGKKQRCTTRLMKELVTEGSPPQVMFFQLLRFSLKLDKNGKCKTTKISRPIKVDVTINLKDIFKGWDENMDLLYGTKQAMKILCLFSFVCFNHPPSFTFHSDLRSYVDHTGSGFKSGHYVNYSNICEGGDRVWYECNDSTIKVVNSNEMEKKLNKCKGYLFAFIKREV